MPPETAIPDSDVARIAAGGTSRARCDRLPRDQQADAAIESMSTLSDTPVDRQCCVGAQRAAHDGERFVVLGKTPAGAGRLGAFTSRELLEREPQRWPPRVAPRVGGEHGAANREGAADRTRDHQRARRAMRQNGDHRTRDQQRDTGGERDLRGDQADGRTGDQTDGGDGGNGAHTGRRCNLRSRISHDSTTARNY